MKFGIISDTHLASPNHPPAQFHNAYDFKNVRNYFESALSKHVADGVDAIIMPGDLANGGDEPNHRIGLEICQASGLPVWIMPGNHDCEEGASVLNERITALNANSIRIPQPGGETIDRIRFAGLPTSSFATEAHWMTHLPEINLWGDDLVLMITHAPAISLASIVEAAGLKYAGDTGNHSQVAELLRQRSGPTLVIHGHLHLRHTIVEGALLQIEFAALVEPPHATAILEITNDERGIRVEVQHDSVAPSDVAQLPLMSPAQQSYRFANGAWTGGRKVEGVEDVR